MYPETLQSETPQAKQDARISLSEVMNITGKRKLSRSKTIYEAEQSQKTNNTRGRKVSKLTSGNFDTYDFRM